MRTYEHLFTGDGCEARGCRIRTRSLHQVGHHVLRACTPAHAEIADRHLTEAEADELAGRHYYEGEDL